MGYMGQIKSGFIQLRAAARLQNFLVKRNAGFRSYILTYTYFGEPSGIVSYFARLSFGFNRRAL
jgi:hypothetical protein